MAACGLQSPQHTAFLLSHSTDAALKARMRKSDSKSADSAAKRRMSAVLPDWSEINRVGAEVSRSDGLVTDTALKYSSGASL